MSDSNTQGAFFTGFILGMLAGAAAALLITPQSGEDTRLQIRERGFELKSRVDDVTAGLQERGKVIVEEKLPRHEAPAREEATGASAAEGNTTVAGEVD